MFQKGLSSHAFLEEGLDTYGQTNKNFSVCQSYINDIQKTKLPWYGFVNGINIYICHRCLSILQDLHLVEEAIIAWAYLIITIIKLRLNSANIIALYSKI